MSAAALDDSPGDRPFRSRKAFIAFSALALGCVVALVALGTWQLDRRQWKADLIRRVEQRVHAPPAPAPRPDEWPGLDARGDEYRRVRLVGTYLDERETWVHAGTELGTGYWVMTPLRTADGAVWLVNRGFVSAERKQRAARAAGDATAEHEVIGLLRASEPGGGLLRRNDPDADRWYSRDVAAIAVKRGLARVAPFFVDAPAGSTGAREDEPVGGLTVITFADNHLVYALTWYALALLVAIAYARVLRAGFRRWPAEELSARVDRNR
jgi:surfeit locus 1 family protein